MNDSLNARASILIAEAFSDGWEACRKEEYPFDLICMVEQLTAKYLGWA